MASSGMKWANIKKILGHNRYINQENLEIVLFITNLYIHQSINVVSLKRMWVHSKSNHSEKDKKKGKYHNDMNIFGIHFFMCI